MECGMWTKTLSSPSWYWSATESKTRTASTGTKFVNIPAFCSVVFVSHLQFSKTLPPPCLILTMEVLPQCEARSLMRHLASSNWQPIGAAAPSLTPPICMNLVYSTIIHWEHTVSTLMSLLPIHLQMAVTMVCCLTGLQTAHSWFEVYKMNRN